MVAFGCFWIKASQGLKNLEGCASSVTCRARWNVLVNTLELGYRVDARCVHKQKDHQKLLKCFFCGRHMNPASAQVSGATL